MAEQLNIDKTNWKLTKVGDIADDISVRVDNPGNSVYDRFVGLENFVSGDIKIRNWSSTENLASSAKAFKSGDILFARRNAYLRRASMVDFDGCCSGDAFVLRENHDKIVPGFLAFLMNSNKLWNFANSNAAGTMSKRVKWRDLANYEFLLPPKEEQQRLAELLWAMDEVIEKEKKVLENIEISKRSLLRTIYNQKADLKTIKEVCEILDNRRIPLNQNQRNDEHGKIPYYGANGLAGFVDTPIFDEKIVLVAEDGGNFYEFHSKPISYVVDGESWVNNHAHVLKFKDEKTDEDWLFYQLVHRNITKHITGTTRLKLTKGELEKIKIWMPSYSIIQNYLNKLNLIYQTSSEFNSKLQSSQSLQKSLINQIF